MAGILISINVSYSSIVVLGVSSFLYIRYCTLYRLYLNKLLTPLITVPGTLLPPIMVITCPVTGSVFVRVDGYD